jgi:hypothetical protein
LAAAGERAKTEKLSAVAGSCEIKDHHNVTQRQDNYYEIIAAGYSEKRISYDAGELKRLVDEG